jgi:transcriptional regulator with XRE-family HTH domain
MAGRPQESARTGATYKLAEFLNQNWDDRVGRTNNDVAIELGYESANIISMWRTGRTRVPLKKLPDIARLLKVDLVELLPLWFEQDWGDRPDASELQTIIGSHIATESEAKLLRAIRKARPQTAVAFTDAEIAAVAAVVGS